MSGRGLKIGLAVSLVVNVFTLGALGGLLYVHGVWQPVRPPANPNPMVRAADVLSPTQQAAFKQMLRQQVAQDRPTIRDSRQAKRRMVDLLAAPTFDQAAVSASLAQARADDIAVRTHLEEGVVNFAANLSPADRVTFADGFRKAALARWMANHPGATKPPAQ
jgi:uncharacterized membrane protein